jgi:hypothetical protein
MVKEAVWWIFLAMIMLVLVRHYAFWNATEKGRIERRGMLGANPPVPGTARLGY